MRPTKYLINISNPTCQARWKDIELSIMNDPPAQAVLAHKNLGRFIDKVQNSWIKAQLKINTIKNTIKEKYKLDCKLQIMHWCAYDPEFKATRLDYRFKSWVSRNNDILFSYGKG